MCNLTDVQKRKIELAGRGDVARLLDRAERLKKRFDQYEQFQTVDEILEWATEIAAERDRLQVPLGSGTIGEGTLFIKVLTKVLTPEQSATLDRRLFNPVAPTPVKGLGIRGGGFF